MAVTPGPAQGSQQIGQPARRRQRARDHPAEVAFPGLLGAQARAELVSAQARPMKYAPESANPDGGSTSSTHHIPSGRSRREIR